jgi:murein L,D-transpeptidase YcbB/YkuD
MSTCDTPSTSLFARQGRAETIASVSTSRPLASYVLREALNGIRPDRSGHSAGSEEQVKLGDSIPVYIIISPAGSTGTTEPRSMCGYDAKQASRC